VLNANVTSDVLNKIDDIVSQILRIMGLNSSNVDAVTFQSIKLGSVTIDGSATPPLSSAGSVSSASAALSASLGTGTSLGGFPVTASSVVSNGVTT